VIFGILLESFNYILSKTLDKTLYSTFGKKSKA